MSQLPGLPDEPLAAGSALTESEGPESRIERWRLRGIAMLDRATVRVPLINGVIVAAERERATGGGLLAGGVAYRLFFWMIPLGLAVTAVAAIAGTTPGDGSDLTRGRGIASVVTSIERQAIEQSHSARWYLLLLGVALTVWFGFGVVRSLNVAHALAWGGGIRKVRRPLLAGMVFTVVAGLISAAGVGVSEGLGRIGLGSASVAITMIVVYGTAAFFISLAFPHGDAPSRALMPGAVMLSVAAIGVHVLVDVYLAPKVGRSVSTFGMLGAASVILLWLYIVARLIILSAFLNATLWQRHMGDANDIDADRAG